MSALIIYTTTHGTTEKAALFIKKRWKEESVALNVKYDKLPAFESFDTIIIGVSVHMGTIPRKMRQILAKEEAAFLEKKLGLFMCCMYENIEAQLQFEQTFTESLRAHAHAQSFFGGELLFSEMNLFEKVIAKKVAGSSEDVSKLNYEEIERFIKNMQMEHPSSPDDRILQH